MCYQRLKNVTMPDHIALATASGRESSAAFTGRGHVKDQLKCSPISPPPRSVQIHGPITHPQRMPSPRLKPHDTSVVRCEDFTHPTRSVVETQSSEHTPPMRSWDYLVEAD